MAACLVCSTTASAPQAAANTIKGVVRLTAQAAEAITPPIMGFWRLANGVIPVASPHHDWRAHSLVVLETNSSSTHPSAGEIVMEDSLFAPAVILVESGSSVRFTNRDAVLHLIEPVSGSFMTSESIGPGETATHTFDKPGAYHLRCSEVTHMTATVLVVPHGQAATIDETGSFRFADVPQGVHTLQVWFQNGWGFRQSIDARGKPVFLEAEIAPPAAQKE